ncbi:MAG TPA: hypothetical protein DDY78_12860 [Planctomycetales bacterium]|jgi:hypothetical protein|nr:hypothetical protein [Planctomycetales bacterium]
MPSPPGNENEFARASADQAGANLFGDFWNFLRVSKKWWLLPIVIVLLVLGLLLLMSGTAAAPFIYTLF